MGFWTQKRVWIIGASSGIGEGLVEVLVEKGAKLLILARNKLKLDELKSQFPKAEIRVLLIDVEIIFDLCQGDFKRFGERKGRVCSGRI